MTSSLVGSEMCIRDSISSIAPIAYQVEKNDADSAAPYAIRVPPHGFPTVSYTHLTLPTICSV
eukprot:4880443-Prorocentrum_lima.AAC.1